MPYTVLASWDFRTTDSTTARTTRRLDGGGSAVLTATGSPSYTANGVELATTGSDFLGVTLPSVMKPATDCGIMFGFRRTAAVASTDRTIQFLFDGTNTSLSPFISPLRIGYQSATDGRFGIGTSTGVTDGSAAGALPALNTDLIWFAERTSASNGRLLNSSNSALVSITTGGSWHTYSTNSELRFYAPHRFAWLVMYSGTMNDAERTAVVGNPDSVIYGTGGNAPRSAFYHLQGMR